MDTQKNYKRTKSNHKRLKGTQIYWDNTRPALAIKREEDLMENADDRMARKKRIKEETVVAGDYKQI